MIRRNPRGDIPVAHETAFVDHTAILCGMVVAHENVFIGPYAVICGSGAQGANKYCP